MASYAAQRDAVDAAIAILQRRRGPVRAADRAHLPGLEAALVTLAHLADMAGVVDDVDLQAVLDRRSREARNKAGGASTLTQEMVA